MCVHPEECFQEMTHSAQIPRHCRWQELKDMTRSLGGEQSLKAEVFPVDGGVQMGHCTIKGRSDAIKVFGMLFVQKASRVTNITDNLVNNGWDGHKVWVKLCALERSGHLRTIKDVKGSRGTIVDPVRTNGNAYAAARLGALANHFTAYATHTIP
jgi:hypothetical protein